MNDIAANDWRQTIILPNAALREVIASLEKTGLRIVLVCDANRELLGTVTDGDLRRALLRGCNLETPVSEIMFATPLVVSAEIDRVTLLNLMNINRVQQLPVVDDKKQLIGLHVLDNILAPDVYDNTVVIMAGGFGTRMGAHTAETPKPMLKVRGKPMLEHIILQAAAEGFHKFTISLFYLPEVIRDYFGDGSRWNVEISYVQETEPLGTAGALSLLSPRPNLPFIVSNGDVMTDVRFSDMLAFHSTHQAAATMAVRQHELQHPFGVVLTDGVMISGFEEKPVFRSHVNAGIYVLNPKVLDFLSPHERCDMPTLFERLQADQKATIAYPMHEAWMDVGRPEDLVNANSEMDNT